MTYSTHTNLFSPQGNPRNAALPVPPAKDHEGTFLGRYARTRARITKEIADASTPLKSIKGLGLAAVEACEIYTKHMRSASRREPRALGKALMAYKAAKSKRTAVALQVLIEVTS